MGNKSSKQSWIPCATPLVSDLTISGWKKYQSGEILDIGVIDNEWLVIVHSSRKYVKVILYNTKSNKWTDDNPFVFESWTQKVVIDIFQHNILLTKPFTDAHYFVAYNLLSGEKSTLSQSKYDICKLDPRWQYGDYDRKSIPITSILTHNPKWKIGEFLTIDSTRHTLQCIENES